MGRKELRVWEKRLDKTRQKNVAAWITVRC